MFLLCCRKYTLCSLFWCFCTILGDLENIQKQKYSDKMLWILSTKDIKILGPGILISNNYYVYAGGQPMYCKWWFHVIKWWDMLKASYYPPCVNWQVCIKREVRWDSQAFFCWLLTKWFNGKGNCFLSLDVSWKL